MSNGFSLPQCFTMLKNKKNGEIFQEITLRLEQGEKITSFFGKYCPKKYRTTFLSFLQYLPFLDSLSLSIVIVQEEGKLKKELTRNLMYPCLLFVGVMVGIYLFNELCFPSLLSIMEGFHLASPGLQGLRVLLKIVTLGFLLGLILIFGVFVYFCQPSKQVKGYRILQRVFQHSIVNQFVSIDFVRFFLEFIKRSIPTRKTMEVLKNFSQKPLIQYVATEMDQSLMHGAPIQKVLENHNLDPLLSRFFQIAFYSSDMETMLKGYLEMCHQRAQRQCKTLTKAIQCLSYGAIGLLLILVYQLLLLPMNILTTI